MELVGSVVGEGYEGRGEWWMVYPSGEWAFWWEREGLGRVWVDEGMGYKDGWGECGERDISIRLLFFEIQFLQILL